MDIDCSIICSSKRLEITPVSLRGYHLNKPGYVLIVEYYVTIKGNKEDFYIIALQKISLSDKSKRQNGGKNENMHMRVCTYCPTITTNVITRHYCPPDIKCYDKCRATYEIFSSNMNLSSIKSLVLISSVYEIAGI